MFCQLLGDEGFPRAGRSINYRLTFAVDAAHPLAQNIFSEPTIGGTLA